MAYVSSLMDYEPPDFESIIVKLSNGLEKLAVFVQNLQYSFDRRQDDISYIKTELLPSVENSKVEFDEMMTCADRILQHVNHDLEECINNIQRQNEEIKCINSELTSLKTQLEKIECDVRDAERQCDRKSKELSDAESALSTARGKLTDAENEQKAAFIGGTVTAIACAVASPIFPPAIIGAVGGIAVDVAGLTVFEQAKRECDDRVNTARRDVSASQQSLEKARDLKNSIRRKLSDLESKKETQTNKMKENETRRLDLTTKQNSIIVINERIKVFYRTLCDFHGKFRVLLLETRGGYSITMLKSPTLALCGSLSSLLQCPALCESCSTSRMLSMTRRLQQIKAVRWPAISYSDDLV